MGLVSLDSFAVAEAPSVTFSPVYIGPCITVFPSYSLWLLGCSKVKDVSFSYSVDFYFQFKCRSSKETFH